jgi:hypothetical protein
MKLSEKIVRPELDAEETPGSMIEVLDSEVKAEKVKMHYNKVFNIRGEKTTREKKTCS